jgi:nucleotide-binding universal stress UspA family protein
MKSTAKGWISMIKSILVPIGVSSISESSLKTAIDIANLAKAKVNILHVEDLTKIRNILMAYRSVGSMSLDVPVVAYDTEYKAAQEEIDKEKLDVRKMYDEMKSQIQGEHSLIMKEGIVADVILSEIHMADLVVMGKSLKRGATDCLELQPSIFEVIRKSNKPLLAVCEYVKLEGTVLIAYDGSRSANNALKVLGDLLPLMSPKIVILTVKKTEDDARPLLDEAAKYFEPYDHLEVEKVWKTGSATDVIVQVAQEIKASLIVMGGYGDNKLKELFMGSTTEKVLKAISTPVLLSNG